MIGEAINSFTTLFVIMDPIGNAPIFLALTAGMAAAERRRIALRGVLVGAGILTLFALVGDAVLNFVGISMPAFRVAGGLLLFLQPSTCCSKSAPNGARNARRRYRTTPRSFRLPCR